MSCYCVNPFDFALEKLHSRWSARAIFPARKSNELTQYQDMFYYNPNNRFDLTAIRVSLTCNDTLHKEKQRNTYKYIRGITTRRHKNHWLHNILKNMNILTLDELLVFTELSYSWYISQCHVNLYIFENCFKTWIKHNNRTFWTKLSAFQWRQFYFNFSSGILIKISQTPLTFVHFD